MRATAGFSEFMIKKALFGDRIQYQSGPNRRYGPSALLSEARRVELLRVAEGSMAPAHNAS